VAWTAGWYPDPAGRYDHRYHNGRDWTADVAVDGHRFIDPGAVTGGRPSRPPARRNGMATAAMVCGIVGVSLAWIPYLTFAGLPVAIVGTVLGAVALRRTGPGGVGRSAAITGVVAGGLGIVVAGIGIWLTVVVSRALDDFESPEPSDVRLTRCAVDDGTAVAEVELTNVGDDTQTFTVTIELRTAEGAHRERVELESVASRATRTFAIDAVLPGDGVDCEVVSVSGPLPFGIDPGFG
jgi:hypothetical protein